MRRYESIIILDPDLSEDQRSPVLERVKESIRLEGGILALFDDWGLKKLAYEIKKKERGYYVRFDFCGTVALVDEIERFYRIDDRVLKYMTVLIDAEPDMDSLKEEMAKAEIKEDHPEKKEDLDDLGSPESADLESPESEAVEVETPPIENEQEAK
jgi:small subunit ribosomal protein S6